MRSSKRSGISIPADALSIVLLCSFSFAGVVENTLETGSNIVRPVPLSILAAGSAAAWGTWKLEDASSRGEFLSGRVFHTLDSIDDFVYGPFLPVSAALLWAGGELAGSSSAAGFGEELCRGLVFSYGITGVLKYSVGRERPDGSNRLSFPSGHTAGAAALAAVTWNRLGPEAGAVASLFAVYTAFSRVNTGRHYPSDAVMGAAIGTACGLAAGLDAIDENGSMGRGVYIGFSMDTEGRITALLW